MKPPAKNMQSFFTSEDGPTVSEYAVMLALIVLMAITTISLLGNKVKITFTNLESEPPSRS